MARKEIPEINAGSMADIAFLLLIFFLVTTTIATEKGINRKLPPWNEKQDEDPPPIKEKNIFTVLINGEDQLLVEDGIMNIKYLREEAKKFIVNNGDGSCDYCWNGISDPNSSDNPMKAVISLQNNRMTSYKMYLSVQNELVAAYREVREEYALKVYNKFLEELDQEQWDNVRKKIPSQISEAEPIR